MSEAQREDANGRLIVPGDVTHREDGRFACVLNIMRAELRGEPLPEQYWTAHPCRCAECRTWQRQMTREAMRLARTD